MSCTGCCFRGWRRDLHTWVYLSLQRTCQDNYIQVHKKCRCYAFVQIREMCALLVTISCWIFSLQSIILIVSSIKFYAYWLVFGYFVSNCPPFFLLQQAALVLNASRRFRYTLDLKREEQREEVISKIRAQAHVVRVNIITFFFVFFFP